MGRGFESLPRYHPNFQAIPMNTRKTPDFRGFLYMTDLNVPTIYPTLLHMNVGLMWG